MPTFEEEYLDVLQNIEVAIVGEFRKNKDLTDYDVGKALNTLWAEYRVEQTGKTASHVNLNERAMQVFNTVKMICDWRLGRASIEGSKKNEPEPKSVDEFMACLKRIRKSVDLWTKEGGRQGHLKFIDENVGI